MRRPNLIVAVLALAGTTFALLQAVVVPALPEIARALHTTGGAWILTANLLSTAVLTPVLGRTGDIFGKERALVGVLLALAAGTLVCALATSLPAMLAGRVIQGAGGAVFPLAFGILRDELPRDRVPGAIGLVSSLLGLGGGFGLVVPGPIVAHLSYHWLFWLPLGAIAAAIALTIRFIPSSPVKAPGRIHWVGAGLMGAGLSAVLIGVSQDFDPSLLGAGAVLTGLWIRSELRAREPLIDMRMMRLRGVWTANAAAFLLGLGMYASFALIPQLVESPRFGASVTGAGLVMLPLAVIQLVVGPYVGRIERRIGSRAQLQAGMACVLLAFAGLAAEHGAVGELLVWLAIMGAGVALGMGALANLVVVAVRPEQTGVATGMNTVMRTIGGAFGAALTATLIASGRGYAAAFGVCAAALALGLLVSAISPGRRHLRRARPSPSPAR